MPQSKLSSIYSANFPSTPQQMNHHHSLAFPGTNGGGGGSFPSSSIESTTSSTLHHPQMGQHQHYPAYTPSVVHVHGHFYFQPPPSSSQQQFIGIDHLQQQHFPYSSVKLAPSIPFGSAKDEYGIGPYGFIDGFGGGISNDLNNRTNLLTSTNMPKNADPYAQLPLAAFSSSYGQNNCNSHHFHQLDPIYPATILPSSTTTTSNADFVPTKSLKKEEKKERKTTKQRQSRVTRGQMKQPKQEKQPKGLFGPIYCQWIVGRDEDGDEIICGRQFADMQTVVDHLDNEHLGNPPSNSIDTNGESNQQIHICLWQGCSRAGKEFKAKYKLKNHLRVHTGERPFGCDVCHKTFARSENLKIHIRIHTGEKPFPCKHPDCPKVFANSSDRKKHQHVHQQRKPYKCDQDGCDKKYTHPSSLRKHLRAIHGKVMPSGALLAMTSATDERRSGESGGGCGDDSGIGTHTSCTPSELAIISTGQQTAGSTIQQQQQQQREFQMLQRFNGSTSHGCPPIPPIPFIQLNQNQMHHKNEQQIHHFQHHHQPMALYYHHQNCK